LDFVEHLRITQASVDAARERLERAGKLREVQERLDWVKEILRRQKEEFDQVAPGWDDPIESPIPTDEEDQFIELVKLWRLEHPEPPKPRQYPKGITQHESDPDSD
jgi:hypothetical protein